MERRGSRPLRGLDWPTVIIYIALLLMGWLNIYSAVFTEGDGTLFDISQLYGSQLIWIAAACLVALVVLAADARLYSVFAYVIYALAMIALALVLALGVEVNASRSWFEIGTLRVQPAEFAKFATALALARCLSAHGFRLLGVQSYLRVSLIVGLPMGLIMLQPDVGSALVFSALILVLFREGLPMWVMGFLLLLVALFVLELVLDRLIILTVLFGVTMALFALLERRLWGSVRFGLAMVGLAGLLYAASEFFNLDIAPYYIALVPLGVGLPIALILAYVYRLRYVVPLALFLVVTSSFSFSIDYIFHNVLEEHHRNRVTVLLGIESDPLGWGYNVNQSKIAIGSGGLWGQGYLSGTQTKFNFVPEQTTDFIFCTVGEEWGFAGAFVVIALMAALLLRLVALAERQKEAFARIYGYGVIAILFFHMAVNIGMTVGLVPVIGIPLPFFSYGGSSLLGFTMLLFILLKLDSARLQ